MAELKERSPEDRREGHVTHEMIIKRLNELEDKLEPIIETWHDVAVVGRIGRGITKFFLWLGAIAVAVTAIATAIRESLHWFDKTPPP